MNNPQLLAKKCLEAHADNVGECDRCYMDQEPLWILDHNDPAGWQYCESCLCKMAQKPKKYGQRGRFGSINVNNFWTPE